MTRRTIALLTMLLLLVPTLGSGQGLPLNATAGARLQNAATATGNGATLDTSNATAVTFQASGTFSATVTYEGSNDGTNFNSLTCFTLDGSTSASSTSTANLLRCNVLGIPLVRARVSTYSSGSVTVVANASAGTMPGIRDSTGPSGAVTGQLRGTQTTPPTCGTSTTAQCTLLGGGTDSFVKGQVKNPPNWNNSIIVTFNTAYAAAPSCVAARDGTSYGYYVQIVSTATTTATLKLGGPGTGRAYKTGHGWSPGDTFTLLCAGVQ